MAFIFLYVALSFSLGISSSNSRSDSDAPHLRKSHVKTYIYDPALFTSFLRDDLKSNRRQGAPTECKHTVGELMVASIGSGKLSRENVVDDPAEADMFFVPVAASGHCTSGNIESVFRRTLEILETQTNGVFQQYKKNETKANHVIIADSFMCDSFGKTLQSQGFLRGRFEPSIRGIQCNHKYENGTFAVGYSSPLALMSLLNVTQCGGVDIPPPSQVFFLVANFSTLSPLSRSTFFILQHLYHLFSRHLVNSYHHLVNLRLRGACLCTSRAKTAGRTDTKRGTNSHKITQNITQQTVMVVATSTALVAWASQTQISPPIFLFSVSSISNIRRKKWILHIQKESDWAWKRIMHGCRQLCVLCLSVVSNEQHISETLQHCNK
jgi:hypothetical protein